MVRAGILLVDKPGGITSHDVVSRARRALGTRKIGHAGTLDPMATGLLVLGVEGATRLLTYIVGADKTYLATIVLGFFGVSIPLIHESGLVGIGFSLFVIVIAALNLVLDFDFIETGVEQGAPKYMEWYGAFGLMVTLVWLYIEFLRLLSKLQQR